MPGANTRTATTAVVATAIAKQLLTMKDVATKRPVRRPAVGTNRTMALARFSWAMVATNTIIEIAAELLPTLVASYLQAAAAQNPNPIAAAEAELMERR
ncbi:hypothetical protein MDUV_49480 [Mycolicibacterium duvalii]|uniref:Uncharacterized protein n=1 Tax=Mycolicibacterium duvalii TaxID=39688 RepID=A0A7I7K9B8_9MYCO|nr:hypothetical protein MDUV_49480 [Mycolicibacterium duvalii]